MRDARTNCTGKGVTGPACGRIYDKGAGFTRAMGIACGPRRMRLPLLVSLCFGAVSPADIGHRKGSHKSRCHANVCCASGSSLPAVRATMRTLTGGCSGPLTVRVGPLSGFCRTRSCRRSCLSGGPKKCYRVSPTLFKLTGGTGTPGAATGPICGGPSSTALHIGLAGRRCTMARGDTARPTFRGRC